MNKKGFISISVVYSFFLVFIAIVLSILAAYSSRRYMLIEIKDDIRNVIDSKTTYSCFTKGITKLNECILDVYGGKVYIESQETPDFSKITQEGEYGLYATEDDLGTSYYFRGDVKNNYIKFGQNDNGEDMYWRIVRINGDGTIRLIYDGLNLEENGTEHNSTISTSVYNSLANHPKYIGYTYDTSYGDTTQVDSEIKRILDDWYINNLKDYYSDYISDGIFCNDKSITKYNQQYTCDECAEMIVGTEEYFECILNQVSIKKTGTNSHVNCRFSSTYRAVNPVLTCVNKIDRYTVDDTTNGNGYLSNPIGLLTVDELKFSGLIRSDEVANVNKTNYIYSGEAFWTMSPLNYDNSNGADIWMYTNDGRIDYLSHLSKISGVRPTINLKADVEIKKGNGTISSPYVLEEVTF